MPEEEKPGQGEKEVAPDYFTLKELADYSRIGIKKLKEAIDARELLCAFPDSKAIISRKDFEIWFNKQKTKPIPSVESAFAPKNQPKRADVFSFDD